MRNSEKTGSSDEEDVWFDIPDELEDYADCPGTPHIQKFLAVRKKRLSYQRISIKYKLCT